MTQEPRTILAVFAHPDDESMGPGGTLARYAALGHRVAFILATDGGAGRLYEERPRDRDGLKRQRRAETEEAAKILGIEFLGVMGWEDGELHQANILDVEERIAAVIRRERPDVVMTFHGSGISFHGDHRVIALALGGAFLGAARAGWYRDDNVKSLAPHAASKLYHYTVIGSEFERVGWPRELYGSGEDEITTVIDTRDWADTKWRAIQAHESQQHGPPFHLLHEGGVFEREAFVRVHPSWPSGRSERESDLLEGLD